MECVLVSSEIEFYVETMRPTRLNEIAGENWLEWHRRLQKLNQEAIVEAALIKEEHVKETLVACNKSEVLVHEAILISVWKQKILPILLRLEPQPESTFVAYSVLYHEAVAVSLLELMMFHPSGCESLGDTAADLLEYAYEGATQLLVIEGRGSERNEPSGRKEILRQKEDIAFDIGIKCLSIIRYLAENLDKISVGVTSRIYSLHDIPVLFVEILALKPWFSNGKVYHQGKFIEPVSEALNQAEAQIWLTLRHLLLDKATLTHYEITNSRRSQLMKLLPLLTPSLLDQLSPLLELSHFLHQLSVSDLPMEPHKPLLLETILEIRNGILKQGEKRWRKIAREQTGVVFSHDREKLFETAQKLSEAYNTDLLEKFDAEPTNVCTVCTKPALQRCSKCKTDWYCSRTCQINDWTRHKETCLIENN